MLSGKLKLSNNYWKYILFQMNTDKIDGAEWSNKLNKQGEVIPE